MTVCRGHRGASLVLRWFDDGVVVFDEATGSLHALEPAAAMALERIGETELKEAKASG